MAPEAVSDPSDWAAGLAAHLAYGADDDDQPRGADALPALDASQVEAMNDLMVASDEEIGATEAMTVRLARGLPTREH